MEQPSGKRPPREKREVRKDGYVNAFTGHGTRRDRRSYTKHRTIHVTDIEGIDLRRGNWLAAKICEDEPSDGFRRGYVFKGDDKETDEQVMDAIAELGLNDKFREALAMENACGGAALLPVIDGAIGELNEPFVLDGDNPRIAKVLALHLLEPRELMPESWYTDITDPKFGLPETYRLHPLNSGRMGTTLFQVVHESRLVIFPGIKITREPLPGQRIGWGDSKLNRVVEVLSDFGLSWGSAAAILHDFSQGVIKLDQLLEILKEDGGEALLQKRVEAMDMVRSSMRAMLLDKNDEFTRTSTSLAGLSELLVQMMTLVAGAANEPATRLFGRSPDGMNATGESDMRGWADTVGNKQTSWTKRLEWLIRLLLLSTDGPTGGEEPDVWSIDWKPLQTPSEKETADTRLATAQADQIYFNMGAASSDDIATSRWKGDTYSADMTIDWGARAKQQKLDAQQALKDQAALAAMGKTGTDPNAVNGTPASVNGTPAIVNKNPAALNKPEA